MLVTVTDLGKMYFGEDKRGREMNVLLCERGYQTSRKPKKGYDYTEKGKVFCKKMEPGKLYWHTSILSTLNRSE